ncbi:MAG: DEAD/DEAH box helicase, partial [Myxococcaceae bacterium]
MLNSAKAAASIRSRMVEFAAERCFLRGPNLMSAVRDLWCGSPSAGGLVGDLWVEPTWFAETSTVSLKDLVATKEISGELVRMLAARDETFVTRPLYVHQLQAIRAARGPRGEGRPAVVVTAPTGSGKTESFLLPVLDSLLRRPRSGRGMRCLVLYPMNALVNDQTERLDEWLSTQTALRLFHFTSETPEDHEAARRRGSVRSGPHRVLTREEARGREAIDGHLLTAAPDIVVTNYSMLEYMLCRPQDSTFFDGALEAIVLDEAHLYSGTLALEIRLLLRRVAERCSKDPDRILFAAGSATLASSGGDLANFFQQLTSKSRPDLVEVIQGRATNGALHLRDPSPPAKAASASAVAQMGARIPQTLAEGADGTQLVADAAGCDRLMADLSGLVAEDVVRAARREAADHPARLLLRALSAAPRVHALVDALSKGATSRTPPAPLNLATLAAVIFPGEPEASAVDAAIVLLHLAAVARAKANEFPLVPHRLHLFVRAPSGISICLEPKCSAPEGIARWAGLGAIQGGGQDRCRFCSSLALSLVRCDSCGSAFVGSGPTRFQLGGAPQLSPVVRRVGSVWVVPSGQGDVFGINARTGEIGGGTAGDVMLARIWNAGDGDAWRCSTCGETDLPEPMGAPDSLLLGVAAQALLAELDPYPGKARAIRPAGGRRLLAFSDSRRAAALLGPRLMLQHETQIVRRAILRAIEPVSELRLRKLRQDVSDYEEGL